VDAYWFDPATGSTQNIQRRVSNPGSMTVDSTPLGGDRVVVIEDSSRSYPQPGAK
jgi:hypothetical protein